MAKSENYNTLRDVWVKWRDASGKTIRDDYKKYIELENEAAVRNGKLQCVEKQVYPITPHISKCACIG